MPSFESYRDINAWQNARKLTKHVHGICKELDVKREWVLKDQLFRASLSIMNNIAEGFGRFSNLDFLRFLTIARGSGYETGSCLDVLEDINVVAPEQVTVAHGLLKDTLAPMGGLMSYLHTQDAADRSGKGKRQRK